MCSFQFIQNYLLMLLLHLFRWIASAIQMLLISFVHQHRKAMNFSKSDSGKKSCNYRSLVMRFGLMSVLGFFFFYCCHNYHKFSGLKQNKFVISHPVGQRSEWAKLVSVLQVPQAKSRCQLIWVPIWRLLGKNRHWASFRLLEEFGSM